jgi:hypothetical protein
MKRMNLIRLNIYLIKRLPINVIFILIFFFIYLELYETKNLDKFNENNVFIIIIYYIFKL